MGKKVRPVRVNHADVIIFGLNLVGATCQAVSQIISGQVELMIAYSAWLDERFDAKVERKRFLEDAEAEMRILTRSE